MNNRIKTVSTLIIINEKTANKIVKKFKPTLEVEMLISVKFKDLLNGKFKFQIPKKYLMNAKMLYKNAKTNLGYLIYYLKKDNHYLCEKLLNIPDKYRLLCQVEVPKNNITRYKNIDIGFTSNGKIELYDKNPMYTSIRETREESRIILKKKYFSQKYQKIIKDKENIDLPEIVYFEEQKLLLYILVL